MKKIFALTTSLLLTALIVLAFGFALAYTPAATAEAEGEAETTGYIYIAPTDDMLVTTNSDGSLTAVTEAERSTVMTYSLGGSTPSFYLTESYCYEIKLDTFTISDEEYYELLPSSCGGVSGVCVKLSDLPTDCIYTSLPSGGEVLSLTLSIAGGNTISTGSSTIPTITSDYTITFLGYTDTSETTVAYTATLGDTRYNGTTAASNFEEFAVEWSAVAKARQSTLIAAANASDTSNADLVSDTPSEVLRIVLIIGIAIPALLIVALLFVPSAESKRNANRRSVSIDKTVDYDRGRSYEGDRDRYERGYRDYERRDYDDYDRR